MKIIFITIGLFTSLFANSQTLQKALEKYAKATAIEFDIKKTDEKVILGTKAESRGVLKYQQNKIYISLNGDKKTEFIYTGKSLALIEYPDADFDPSGKRKVTLLKKNVPPLVKSLLNLFSNPKQFRKDFAVVSESAAQGILTSTLKSSQKNIKSFTVKISEKDLTLTEISFVDEVDTKTTIEFTNQKLNAKISKSDFQYKPLKTDEVMPE